jgi:flagellar export protein FliJ
MGAILKRIIRLRRLDEQQARLSMVEARMKEDEQAQQLVELGSRVAVSHRGATGERAELVTRHHAFALRSEMVRRRGEAELRQTQAQVEERREHLQSITRHRQLVQELSRLESAREREESDRRDQKVLDETGLRGWWRVRR